MATRRITSEDIATALRQQICLEPPAAMVTLHEHAPAQQFGVSRTPVRQALQRLTYERLAEVRSGIGTVVMPLDPATRHDGQELADALCRMAADLYGLRKISPDGAARLSASVMAVEDLDSLDISANLDLRAGVVDTLVADLPNPILADAFRSSIWRMFRWRMAEAAATPDGFDPLLRRRQSAFRTRCATGG